MPQVDALEDITALATVEAAATLDFKTTPSTTETTITGFDVKQIGSTSGGFY